MSSIQHPASLILLTLCLVLTPSCALLKKPNPVTQLQLTLDAAAISWPPQLALGSVQARKILQSDRVIVTSGARVMQHAGLRWVAAPAALINEQLGLARANQMALAMASKAGQGSGATLDIWLSEFNVVEQVNGGTQTRVSALASLRCNRAVSAGKSASAQTPAVQLPAVARAVTLNSSDPQRLAESFNEASTAVFAALIKSALGHCGL
jgi:hypothetical protein